MSKVPHNIGGTYIGFTAPLTRPGFTFQTTRSRLDEFNLVLSLQKCGVVHPGFIDKRALRQRDGLSMQPGRVASYKLLSPGVQDTAGEVGDDKAGHCACIVLYSGTRCSLPLFYAGETSMEEP